MTKIKVLKVMNKYLSRFHYLITPGNIIFSLVLFICLTPVTIIGQQYYDFGFERNFTVQVRDSLGALHNNPWGGGMNSCHFSTVDFDLDGVEDLFVFDKDGDKILCFKNNGSAGNIDYTYMPEYAELIPRIKGWAIFVDYNCDGKKDIFTYTTGGIMVYKNVSDTDLKFTKAVQNYLVSYQWGGYTNIWVTYADYPAFSDIDNDGDIDILTFGVLGSWLGYHKNLSMEKYGHCDSLDYILEDYSWGCFAESEESNVLTLDTCYESKGKGANIGKCREGDIKHTGSTLLAIDLDGDSDKDLIFGDVDYPNIIQLINGGTPDSAYMISQDTAFPSYDVDIEIFSFPALCYLDVDNNNVKDLIVAPFDPALDKSANYKNIWLYANTGSNDVPHFVYQRNDFLQGEMIDVGAGAYPVLFDYDCDGLQDIVLGNYGYLDSAYYDISLALHCTYRSQLALYRNTGTNINPSFKLITRNFAGISSMNLLSAYPSFSDLDGDGDIDMLLGNSEGSLHYFENIAGPGNPADFVLSELNFQGINVGEFSTPQLIDLDRDGLDDLVCGKKDGKLAYFQNTGTSSNPVFTKLTDEFGAVDVSDSYNPYYAYSVPCFFKDNNDEFRLFAGSVSGHLHYYKNIDNNLNGDFTLDNDNYLWLYEGIRSSVAVHDLDNDGYFDMIMGNYSGGLGFYLGVDPPLIGINENENNNVYNVEIYPNPTKNILSFHYNKGLVIQETLIYNMTGQIILRQQLINNCIDVSKLEPGLYIIEIVFSEWIVRKKVLIN
ncbi:MAG: T9SS type A sorting domain-containing protein [Bacteroidales bacterium]|nr:T9SS type A sorting domain-containing protein [Bacteroidales bacterium]